MPRSILALAVWRRRCAPGSPSFGSTDATACRSNPSQVRAVPTLLSHRPPFSFPLSMRPYRSLSCDMRARRFLFPTIPTRRTLSVTIVTSLDFIFSMSDIRNAETFDLVFASSSVLSRLATSRDLFICAKYLLFETCSLPDACSVVHLALKCSDIFEHVGLRTLLDDSALPQIAQDATDVLARHPGHGSQILPADPLVEQNLSPTCVLADI